MDDLFQHARLSDNCALILEEIADFFETIVNMDYWFLIFNEKGHPDRASKNLKWFMDILNRVFE